MLHSSKFRPAWWLRNPHAQTLWAAKIQAVPAPVTSVERLTTPDNDFVDLTWTETNNGPVVIIFHGLTGSVDSHYARSLMHSLNEKGLRAVLMHFRGCSGEPNKTRGSYHSGDTRDIAFVIDTIAARYPQLPIAAAGFSLGGNALLKYLGTTTESPLQFAISVSPPLLLEEGAKRMNKGFSRVYQRRLIKQLKTALRIKQARYPELGLDEFNINSVENFFEFDHHITAPLHGFEGSEDYYRKASTLTDLINIKIPTHILWSADDPFFSNKCIPTNDQLSEAVHFELTTHGGHVGFISGNIPLRGHNWLCERISGLLVGELCR